jgi:LysR family transcriptional regulator, hydrogen peroxide-inducible genes activator
MELHQIRYFIALCESLNFTRAAEACNVCQSVLTRAIQRLEAELGGPLFHRERKLTQLTALGRLLRPMLEQSLAKTDEAKQEAAKFLKGDKPTLRLGICSAIPARGLREALCEAVRRLPALEIHIAECPQPRIVEQLLHGELDTAFLGGGELPERLEALLVHEESFRIAVAPDHRLARLDRVSLSALAGESILERRGCPMAATLRDLCAQMGATVRVRHLVDTEHHLQHLAATSLGIALLPEPTPLIVPLVTRKIVDADLKRSVVLGVVSGRRFSPALDLFIKISRARHAAATDRRALVGNLSGRDQRSALAAAFSPNGTKPRRIESVISPSEGSDGPPNNLPRAVP